MSLIWKSVWVLAAMCVLGIGAGSAQAGEFPRPSPYPIVWELDFVHSKPERVVVDIPGHGTQAYWYTTYTITNRTDREQTFLPVFELVTEDGRVHRSERRVPYRVYEEIKKREGSRFLEHFTSIGGELRIGEDESRDGVAIWPEPMAEMGSFSIFITGLSGETVTMKDDAGNPLKDEEGRPIILRKTLQLNYFIRGDEVYPGEDAVNENPTDWVMR